MQVAGPPAAGRYFEQYPNSALIRPLRFAVEVVITSGHNQNLDASSELRAVRFV
jgi:hypothetical protein